MASSIPFTDRIADGWRRSADALWLVFVPVVTALFSVDKILRITLINRFHVGFKFLNLPSPIESVWRFVNVPQSGVHIDSGPAIPILAVLVLVTMFLLGGYLGSIRRLLDADEDQFDFTHDAFAYLGPMAVWAAVPSLVTVSVAMLAGGFGTVEGNTLLPLVFVIIAGALVFGYLFYAAPFLVVLRETGLVDALRGSYHLAVSGGPYASYALGYVFFSFVVSGALSLIVVNLGIVGLLVGIPLGGRLGLATTTATMRFVADVDDQSPTLCEWDDGGDDPFQQNAGEQASNAYGKASNADDRLGDEFDRDGTR
ncbi:hypothetical protein C499_01425 [Halogeometricum borinquense DSM 11551]|uniref:DUF4013 domain-containing protein n=1 Tax=Halogeometricum borinquense (strain ATCC 700274 / DSM 11551 / JCM 10706 / KCTC 4070 / PR3) TaxID=469382 RepID=E4NNM1_HALBP|nr:hypothetical protein [Halogeometricum borinquense]ADQ66375.1 hypothetical protein Hbor_07780 [Halogeometricum borinquense DSM 11551]ELY31095.1 hypothetical protein C499_01425 [Halogeometricum borinquense DSM 11551]